MEKMIRIENLNKIYKNGSVEVHALKDVNMEVAYGEFLAVMGHSGSGKSTLMNILGCLDRPTSGKYFLDGIDIDIKSPDELSLIRNKKIGFVFQAFNLIPRTNVLRNVELPMIYAKVKAKQRRERALELLEKVGLSDRVNHMPNELSGGQKQRVAIARALANNPPIILADEPTGNLDPDTSWEIMELLSEFNKKGTTVVVATHARELVDSMKKRVLQLDKGRLVRDEERGLYSHEA